MIVSEIELLKVHKVEKAAIRVEGAIQLTATEVKANHVPLSHRTPSHEHQSFLSPEFHDEIFG